MSDLPDTLNVGTLPSPDGIKPDSITGLPGDRASAAPLTAIPGYEITGELGRGGMGVVYKARQESLGRSVALKMLLAGQDAREDQLTRFRAEAEAVARLQHPNIVQVYEIGQFQGRPYFSLEFVSGGNLAQRINGAPQDPRAAAELMGVLARAVEFAHQQGIVHRDLKPANVLLTSDGSPKIGDFGLAKQLTGGSDLTRTGEILGTPSYMAPEQAQGAREATAPADIYALGAILYELLTGRPPFRGQDPVGTMLLVCTAEPVTPRQLIPAVPRDLETIALKCLEKLPRRRYATAGDLADDLQRYLDGQPIRARAAGWLEITAKWMRRRPATAALLIGSLLAGLAFTSYSVWKNNQLAAALARTQQQRERAERNFRRVIGASERRFAQADRAQADELEFYDEILARPGDDPGDRYEKGLAARRAGDIHRNQQAFDKAAQSYDTAAQYLEGLVAEFPAQAEYRRDLAAVLGGRGNLAETQGQFAQAETAHRQALVAFEALLKQSPTEVDYARQLSVEWNNLAAALSHQGKFPEAFVAHEEGLAIRRRMVEHHPTTSHFRNDLAISLTNLAALYTRQGKLTDAETLLRESLTVRAKLQDSDADFESLHAQATTLANLAVLLGRQKKPAECVAATREALAAFERLARDYPQSPLVVEQLADTHANLGFQLLFDAPAESTASFRAAAALIKQLSVRYPKSAKFPRLMARQWCNVGMVEMNQNHPAEAEAAYQLAIAALRESLARGLPDRAALATAPDLFPIHEHADFQKLLKEAP